MKHSDAYEVEVAERRLERLERRYRRVQYILAGARATQRSLNELPDCDPRRRRQAQQEILGALQSLEDIQRAIDQLEERTSFA